MHIENLISYDTFLLAEAGRRSCIEMAWVMINIIQMWYGPQYVDHLHVRGLLPVLHPPKIILQSFSDLRTQRRPPALSHPLCVAVALASAAPEVSVPGRISSQCSTALRTNLPVCLSWPWLTQAQPTWLTPDTNHKWTPDSRRRRMADTALKFGPEWLRALTEPQGGTDGGGEPDSSSPPPCTSCC